MPKTSPPASLEKLEQAPTPALGQRRAEPRGDDQRGRLRGDPDEPADLAAQPVAGVAHAELSAEMASLEPQIAQAALDGDRATYSELTARRDTLPRLIEAAEIELLRARIEYLEAVCAELVPQEQDCQRAINEGTQAIAAARAAHRQATTERGQLTGQRCHAEDGIRAAHRRLLTLLGGAAPSARELIEQSIARSIDRGGATRTVASYPRGERTPPQNVPTYAGLKRGPKTARR